MKYQAKKFKHQFRNVYHKLLDKHIKPNSAFDFRKGTTKVQKSNYNFVAHLDWLSHFTDDSITSKQFKRFEQIKILYN